MIFKDFEEDQFYCSECYEIFPNDFDIGIEDQICPFCYFDNVERWKKNICPICKKTIDSQPLNQDHWTNIDGDWCHEKCAKKLTEEQIEEYEWVPSSNLD